MRRRSEESRRIGRSQHPDGMRIESDDTGRAARFLRGIDGGLNHGLVAKVYPIKNADRRVERSRKTTQFRQLANHLHKLGEGRGSRIGDTGTVRSESPGDQAPRRRDTSGSVSILSISCRRSPCFNSSKVTERSRSNFPDFVRRRAFRWAPHPSFWPMSWA